MKTFLFLFWGWLGLIASVKAQHNLPPVFEISTDSAFFRLDTTYFQILEDVNGVFTVKQVLNHPAFRHDKFFARDRHAHTYWIRMRLKNARPHPLRIYYCDFNSDYIDLYRQDSTGQWQHQQTGDLVPYSELPIHNGTPDRARLFFTLAPGQETTLYERAHNTFWHPPLTYLSPQLQTEQGRIEAVFKNIVTEKGWKNYLIEGIIIGILFLASCYNLFVYYSIKDRVYLYFGVCLLFFVVDRNYYRLQLAFFEEYPYEVKLIANFFFIIFFIFFVQSIRKLLQPPSSLARLDKIISTTLILTVVANIVQIIGFSTPIIPKDEWALLIEVLIRFIYGLCMFMAYRRMKQGLLEARYLLLALTPLFLLWLFTLTTAILGMYFNVDLPRIIYENVEYVESACFAWMIIVFTGALMNRYKLIRQQVIQQAIEKEQLEKEQEIERNRLIAAQNERLEREVEARTAALRHSLEELKTTQDQLIQQEKLASLGELTAGIAHEIQNPLNFVNNFSDVSTELVEELKEGPIQQLPDSEKAYAEEIMGDLIQNLQKITHHGKRADSIVKGMLAHSRSASGQKQPTKLNELVEEFLRIAYHGLRAKDKSFNVELQLNLDPSIGLVNLVPQDIGRVLLNLYNNAFYAIQSKQKQADKDFQPLVLVRTKADEGFVIICVRDNGIGIPNEILHKIYQPFFTTKPTGQGTGLGLSLSYDIITKGHNGDIQVHTQPGEGTEFIIKLPN
ncbi:ATP-binding protein [Spirosoma aerolatum]|uniref:ATP-binding protein n=1 Tax=Spirosoma aerolatum TaxID=1211326 RepID=UPI0014767264|nr:ATP-binding protein [Spirosoma aerolatum]